MRAIASFGVYTVLVFAIPLYGNFIYDRFKAHEYSKAILHSVIALIMISGIFFAGWYGMAVQTAAAARTLPALEYLSKQNFEEEAKLRKQKKLLGDSSIDQGLRNIKVKFDEAAYAETKNDVERALQLYTEIERGSDENGTFLTFPSACIKNNMAVDYFRKQGDKGFKASSVFFDALRIDPKPQHHLDLIQRNIEAIDRYVNP
jgi:hypothetical protein